MDTNFFDTVSSRYRYLGQVLQNKWTNFLNLTSHDPEILWVLGTCTVFFVVYWTYAGFFTFMDITNRPKFLRKYKVQPGTHEPVDPDKLMKAVKNVLMIQTIVSIPSYYVVYHLLFKHRCAPIEELPTLAKILFDFVIISVVEEFMFYYIHLLMHHKSIYKHAHKVHHEWTAPVAAMAFYCHPLEHIFLNILPVSLTFTVVRTHVLTVWIFLTLALINSMGDHAGYSFPYSASSVRFHDYHHAKFNFNYGMFGWLDKFHGTFRETDPKVLQHQQKTSSSKIGKRKAN